VSPCKFYEVLYGYRVRVPTRVGVCRVLGIAMEFLSLYVLAVVLVAWCFDNP
jgi:hypothetical protein